MDASQCRFLPVVTACSVNDRPLVQVRGGNSSRENTDSTGTSK